MCCVAGILLWCIRRIACTIATVKGCLAKCTSILLSPTICFLCSILKFMRKRSRCFLSLKNALQFLLFVFVSSIPLLLLLTDPLSFSVLPWPRRTSLFSVALCVASVGSVITELFQATSKFDLKYFPHSPCCKKFLGPWRGSILSRLLLDEQTKYFARTAGTVCFCERKQGFSFVLNAFLIF